LTAVSQIDLMSTDDDLAPDPGSFFTESQDKSGVQSPLGQSSDPGTDANDSLGDDSQRGTPIPDDGLAMTDFLFDPDFEPNVDELRDSLNFVRALRNASLENGDLSAHFLERLHNPPTCELKVDDLDELYSLKQFLATENSLQQVYTNIQKNHNNCFPNKPMLSQDQIKIKMAEWSGVVPIVNDMCVNTCIAYAGPFQGLAECLICGEEHFQPCRMNSQQKNKARKKFYTLPLGPQLPALMRSPEGARRMHGNPAMSL
jgi:hypothetical protein